MRQLSIYLAMIDEPEDRQKFEQLYNNYVKYLLAIAKNILQDYQLAEDAVSDTFLYLAKNMNKIDEPVSERTKALLITVVKHVSIDILRKKSRKNELLIEPDAFSKMEQLSFSEDDTVNRLADAIVQLPENYKTIIMLKYAEGYNNSEIATLLGYTKSNVDKMVTRGKNKLKKIMREMHTLEIS